MVFMIVIGQNGVTWMMMAYLSDKPFGRWRIVLGEAGSLLGKSHSRRLLVMQWKTDFLEKLNGSILAQKTVKTLNSKNCAIQFMLMLGHYLGQMSVTNEV